MITLTDVEKTYPDGTHAVRGVSFTINEGEFVSIMGPSGSGKSTILHILGFLDRHTKGTYLFEGKTFSDYSASELARIRNKKMGFVFQMFNLLPRASLLENVKLPLLYSKLPKSEWDARAKDVIERVGLSHRLSYEPAKLSGGEKQRAAIARALVNDPPVIFADEPTGNLDSKSGAVIMKELQQLNAEGKTVILITHESKTAQFAERIISLKDGVLDTDIAVNKRYTEKDNFIK